MAAPAKAEALLPVTEVAALWRCSVDHVYDLIAAGKLRSLNLARGRAKTRVPESALAEFVARNTRRTKETT
jgi:excisionase family DNA binding protein